MLKFFKSPAIRRVVQNEMKKSGAIWRSIGLSFEEWAIKHLFRGGNTQIRTGRHIADVLWRGWLIEIKTTRHLSGGQLSQLREFAAHAKEFEAKLVYLFLEAPDPITAERIRQAGGRIFHIFP